MYHFLFYSACPKHLYGDGCTKQCHCRNDVDVCDHNGVCKNGCAPGWIGIRCDTREFFLFFVSFMKLGLSNQFF